MPLKILQDLQAAHDVRLSCVLQELWSGPQKSGQNQPKIPLISDMNPGASTKLYFSAGRFWIINGSPHLFVGTSVTKAVLCYIGVRPAFTPQRTDHSV